MKTFVTLFNSYTVHLTKDVGLIPYGMKVYSGFKSYLATYENDLSTTNYILDELKIWRVKKITGNFDVDSLFFLIRNAKKIDVLNIYHMKGQSGLKAVIYKLFNPNGKIYFKFDSSILRDTSRFWKKIACDLLIERSDLISTEIESMTDDMSKSWNKKISFIPNPYNPKEQGDFIPYKNRKNQLLTVGRIGSHQKATGNLIKAFSRVYNNIHEWNLVLVGPKEEIDVDTDFEIDLKEIYKEYPDIKDRIRFVGNIQNRNTLKKIYSESKIFILPSRYEGFGIAAIEACNNGCYFIGTDIPSSRAITENYKYGSFCEVDNIEGLAECIVDACENIDRYEDDAEKLFEIVREKYSLKKIANEITIGLYGEHNE